MRCHIIQVALGQEAGIHECRHMLNDCLARLRRRTLSPPEQRRRCHPTSSITRPPTRRQQHQRISRRQFCRLSIRATRLYPALRVKGTTMAPALCGLNDVVSIRLLPLLHYSEQPRCSTIVPLPSISIITTSTSSISSTCDGRLRRPIRS